MILNRKDLESIKSAYPPGTRIQLDLMGEDPDSIPVGAKGTVFLVDDIGTVHCKFDNGRVLGLLPGVDQFHKLSVRNVSRGEAR
jgi:hypothetical protein